MQWVVDRASESQRARTAAVDGEVQVEVATVRTASSSSPSPSAAGVALTLKRARDPWTGSSSSVSSAWISISRVP